MAFANYKLSIAKCAISSINDINDITNATDAVRCCSEGIFDAFHGWIWGCGILRYKMNQFRIYELDVRRKIEFFVFLISCFYCSQTNYLQCNVRLLPLCRQRREDILYQVEHRQWPKINNKKT